MNFAEIRKFDVSNGPNVRTTLFVSGCTNNCKGCFNKELQSLLELLDRIKKETNKPIWLWSGYIYEDIIKDEKKLKILNFVDVLIDGRFEIDKRNISLKYRGSSNQRVIDLKKSRIENKVIEIAGI